MSMIQTQLNRITSAVYGEEVRGAIHDSIEQCYTDVSTGSTLIDSSVAAATEATTNATTAAETANAAALKLSSINVDLTMEPPNSLAEASVVQTTNSTSFSFALPWARFMYPVFEINTTTHHLIMEVPDTFDIPFQIHNGHLEVVV